MLQHIEITRVMSTYRAAKHTRSTKLFYTRLDNSSVACNTNVNGKTWYICDT